MQACPPLCGACSFDRRTHHPFLGCENSRRPEGGKGKPQDRQGPFDRNRHQSKKRPQSDVGDPTQKIIEHGSSHKIIVVSDEGRSQWSRMINPSVAYGVIKSAKTSVMDVR